MNNPMCVCGNAARYTDSCNGAARCSPSCCFGAALPLRVPKIQGTDPEIAKVLALSAQIMALPLQWPTSSTLPCLLPWGTGDEYAAADVDAATAGNPDEGAAPDWRDPRVRGWLLDETIRLVPPALRRLRLVDVLADWMADDKPSSAALVRCLVATIEEAQAL